MRRFAEDREAPEVAVAPTPVVVAPAPYVGFTYRSGPPVYYGGYHRHGQPWGWYR